MNRLIEVRFKRAESCHAPLIEYLRIELLYPATLSRWWEFGGFRKHVRRSLARMGYTCFDFFGGLVSVTKTKEYQEYRLHQAEITEANRLVHARSHRRGRPIGS